MTPGHGHLRASHADREQVIDTLKVAFAKGRLAKGEFDARISQALVSRTYANLAWSSPVSRSNWPEPAHRARCPRSG